MYRLLLLCVCNVHAAAELLRHVPAAPLPMPVSLLLLLGDGMGELLEFIC